MDVAIELCGWAAMALILGAYALLTAGRLGPESTVYQGMNVAGAGFFIVYLTSKGAWPSVALNVVWLLIGAVALVRIVMRGPSPRP